MSDIIVSPIIQVIIQRLKSLHQHDVDPSNPSNLPLASASLHIIKTLEGLAEMIDDAEEKSTGDAAVRDWLRRLQEALLDVDDAIDEAEFESQPTSATKLQQIGGAVSDIARDASLFNLRSYGKSTSTVVSQGATSHPYAGRSPHIIGRDDEKAEIIDRVLNAADRVSVSAIVGVGGIGKTSLADLVYSDLRVSSTFDVRFWVTVGQQATHIYDVIYPMINQAVEQTPLRFDEPESLGILKRVLYNLLSETRFLLVLDDMVSNELLDWFLGDMADTACKGSAVLVTTRKPDMALPVFMDSYTFRLRLLPEEESYQLLTEYAFASNVAEIQPELEAIAKEILKCCKGVPILLKMVGTYLYNKDTVQQWAGVLDALHGDDEFCNSVPKVFKFISDKLPSYLKLPFCTFSLDKDLGADQLIFLWMALGFLYSDDPNQQPEDIGRKYLKELAGSALCPHVEYSLGGVVRDITLHDLAYDTAIRKAYEQGFERLTPSSQRIGEYARCLRCEEDYVPDVALLKNAHNAKDLWLFMLCEQISAESLREIVSCCRRLRVLGLGRGNIEMLPDSVGLLKHLRYLDIGVDLGMRRLPDSICNLWHLQTLLLHGCKLEELPTGIGRLQNLRCLTLKSLQESLPEDIGQLTSLRTLFLISCPRLASLPSSIKNLKNLLTLVITRCQEMDLMSTSSVEGLKGMDGIDTLLISGLPKFECLPADLGTPAVVMKLLKIQSCQKLTETAWINQFRSLHSLTIEGCPELLSVAMDGTSQFNNLVELVIRDCPSLGNTAWIMQFVSLRSLIIDECRNLVALDGGFSELNKLERLEIRRCPHLTERCARNVGEDWPLIAHVQLIELDGKRFKS